eukprot:TRINITY_DN30595_c0_g1_i1.p1 TRINITY_DN30595_c0_g1~~TRINITY_DN30595_c0_g1_i1.p1  ORF type:complete len:318 (-),score=40.99 TRINITY_DN30595_c0_g1_i1:303-1256(-)
MTVTQDMVDGPSQSHLLKARGDFGNSSVCFEVALSEPGALARPACLGDPISRLGLYLQQQHGASERGSLTLQVASVDTRVGRLTPVAKWNDQETQRADRGENEQHASWSIKPGDKICAVNGREEYMIEELKSAASFVCPKPLSLKLERQVSDIVKPAAEPQQSCSRRGSAPAVLQRLPLHLPAVGRESPQAAHVASPVQQPTLPMKVQRAPQPGSWLPLPTRRSWSKSSTAADTASIHSHSPSPLSSRSSSRTPSARGHRREFPLIISSLPRTASSRSSRNSSCRVSSRGARQDPLLETSNLCAAAQVVLSSLSHSN